MSRETAVYHGADDLPADVVELIAQAERESLTFGLPWYRNFLGSVAQPDDRVRFHVLRRDARARIVLPVFERGGGLPLHARIEALGNYYTSLYAPAVDETADDEDMSALLHSLRRGPPWLASLRLQPMDRDARAYRLLLAGLRRAGLLPFEFYCFGNWFLRVPADWAAYLASRTSKMRSNIKRMEKKLADDGGSVEIIVDRAHHARAVEAYERVYASSWKPQEPYPGFMPGLIARAGEGGWLRLGVVWLKGQPIAAQVWMVANGKADIYKVAYDEAFKDYSPGTVLTAQLMRHVIEQDRVTEVDYLIGDDAYKKTWMSDRRERWGVVAYNPRTLPGALGALRESLGRRLKPVIERLKARRKPASET